MSENITIFSWITIIVFAAAIACCIYPIKFLLPLRKPRCVTLDIATAPLLAILILLATTSIGGTVLRDGFLGSEHGIQPYSVVILIFALAYICISIDITGLFEYIAFQVTKRGGSSGKRLFLYLFILSAVMTIFTSNDVVVLTITPIVCYLTQETKSDPQAYLMSTFVVCNIASMALYIGNPTNIIVAQAYNINFISYSAWMILPTITAILLSYAMCYFMLRKHIPERIPPPPPEAEERYKVRDTWGAIFGSTVLLACLVGLMVAPIFGDVPVWILTLPFAGAMLIKDTIVDLLSQSNRNSADVEVIELEAGDGSQEVDESGENFGSSIALAAHSGAPAMETANSSTSSIAPPYDGRLLQGSEMATDLPPTVDDPTPLQKKWTRWRHTLPTVLKVTERLPWKLAPFSIGMFILCESLSATGWTSLLAILMAHLSVGGHLVPIVLFTGIITILACNIMNNLPMAILFARVFSHPDFANTIHSLLGASVISSDADKVVYSLRRGGMFALIIGSNLGANLTFMGSLAGLMWDGLLRVKGMEIPQSRFFVWCAAITPVVLTGSLGVLIAELVVEGYQV